MAISFTLPQGNPAPMTTSGCPELNKQSGRPGDKFHLPK